jgi:uncharacterized protein (DUF1684 family)
MHRRGKLHVAPVAISDTDEDDSTSTQANSVHSWFRDALIAELGETNATAYWAAVDAVNLQDKPTATGLTNPAPDVAPLDWLVAHAPMLAKAFPAAMKKTYAQMTEIMEPPIGPALTALEKTWYEQLAVAQNKKITPGETHHVTDAMVLEVKLAAKANNETIMESQSHWA